MSGWRGLHNPERHETTRRADGWAWCDDCGTKCVRGDYVCRCCLAAEVERLTADIADRDRRIESAWELCSAWEEIPADELVSALRGTE